MSDFFDEIPSMLQHYRFKRRMMGNLNQMNAPSISNILSTVNKQGTISQTTAMRLADNAIKSRDPNYIAEIQKQLNTEVMDSTPEPFKPLIQAISGTLSVQQNRIGEEQAFDERVKYLQGKVQKLPSFDRTGAGEEILKEIQETQSNYHDYVTEQDKQNVEALSDDLKTKMTYANILTQYDSDPSTPEIDPPSEFRYPQEKLEYDQVERIRKGHKFDPAGGIGELKKVYGLQSRMENQAFLNEQRTADALKLAKEKLDKEASDLLEGKKVATDKSRNSLSDKISKEVIAQIAFRLENEKDAVPQEVITEVLSQAIASPIFNSNLNPQTGEVDDPILSQDDLFQSLHGVVPYGEGTKRIENVLDAGWGTAIDGLVTEFEVRAENERKAGLLTSGLNAIKGHLKAAQDNMTSEYERDNITAIMDLTDVMLSASEKDRSKIDARGALDSINRSILTILETEGASTKNPLTGFLYGLEDPHQAYREMDPLSQHQREALDTLYTDADKSFREQWSWIGADENVVNGYRELIKARNYLYSIIDNGLLDQKMDSFTVAGQSAFGGAVRSK